MKIGIDKINFHISDKYLDIKDLAIARNVEIDKYVKGLGQNKMALVSKREDIVTLASMAANKILSNEDKSKIDLIIFATESSIDQSKAASIYVKSLLNINDYCKCIEMKQACYSATAALEYANGHILLNPDSKVLILAGDISKYGINEGGEVTQGAGAVAMLISKNPSILEFNNDNVSYTEDIMDFWRPNYSKVAFVNGKYSVEKYLEMLEKVSERYFLENKDYSAICLHLPYYKMGYKGILKITNNEKILEEFENASKYNREIGNIYSASLYLSLISLLSNSKTLKPKDNILMYSYGSGAVCEMFSLKLVEGYLNNLDVNYFEKLLNEREKINISEYEKIFFEEFDNNEEIDINEIDKKGIYLTGIIDNKRRYEKNYE